MEKSCHPFVVFVTLILPCCCAWEGPEGPNTLTPGSGCFPKEQSLPLASGPASPASLFQGLRNLSLESAVESRRSLELFEGNGADELPGREDRIPHLLKERNRPRCPTLAWTWLPFYRTHPPSAWENCRNPSLSPWYLELVHAGPLSGEPSTGAGGSGGRQ